MTVQTEPTVTEWLYNALTTLSDDYGLTHDRAVALAQHLFDLTTHGAYAAWTRRDVEDDLGRALTTEEWDRLTSTPTWAEIGRDMCRHITDSGTLIEALHEAGVTL